MTDTIKKTTLRDSAAMRWTALLLLALAMFCAYIFMDILSPIKDLMESTRGWDSKAFGTMEGSETFLNVFVFFLIFAGIILDKMGVRFTAILSGAVMLVGASIKWFAISKSFIGSGLETWFTNHLNWHTGIGFIDDVHPDGVAGENRVRVRRSPGKAARRQEQHQERGKQGQDPCSHSMHEWFPFFRRGGGRGRGRPALLGRSGPGQTGLPRRGYSSCVSSGSSSAGNSSSSSSAGARDAFRLSDWLVTMTFMP